MAERLNKRHSDLVLKRIKTSQLINRLQDNALGTLKFMTGKNKGEPYQLTDGQVRSAIFLIERTVARAEKPIQFDPNANTVQVQVSFVDPPQ